MNRESEAEDFVAWLLQTLALNPDQPSGRFDTSVEPSGQKLNPLTMNFDALDSAAVDDSANRSAQSDVFSFRDIPPLKPGEFSAVQDRFYSLLKHRLRTEIEQKPPLFPWESELLEYEAEPASVRFWAAHLRQLNLPTVFPDSLLEHLLEQCQTVMQSSLQEGAKLVRAVESLFPNQGQALNDLAGLVVAAPARSGATLLAEVPTQYESATEAQRMALSLLATREILGALTLLVPAGGTVSRGWQTETGLIHIEAESVEPGTLRVRGSLPCGGSIEFRGAETEAIAQRPTAGKLGIELFGLTPHTIYPLNVQLSLPDQPLLSFQVVLAD